ncbi:MAG: ABC transporter ATP-binding protein [Pirellulales bacterium]|nr:ABC transporter ATP-binding protein [Pirellulales bacterium]
MELAKGSVDRLAARPMIRVVDVTQHYGVRPVLRDLSLDVQPGELVVLMGPNGMGKTTLMNVIGGGLSPQRGYVEIDGQRRRSTAEVELAIRKKVVYLADRPWLPMRATGREILLAVGRLYNVDATWLIDHVQLLLELFELHECGDSPLRDCSAGQQKKIALCSALVTEAPLMLLDEPFSGGLDPAGLLVMKRLLRQLATERGRTIVLATPVPELVDELGARIVLLGDGRIVADGSAEQLRTESGREGPLEEVVATMIAPKSFGAIERYFQETKR